jgi:hypothetical protein
MSSETCKELEETTRRIKNEAYKHIKAIENTRINVFQASTSIFLKTISTIIPAISVVGSYKVLFPSPQYNPMDLLVVAITIIVVIIMWHYVAKIVDKATAPWRVIMESIGEIHYFRRKSIEAYINKLDEYCRMLIDNSCRADYDVLCLDLNALKNLIKNKTSPPRALSH